MRSSSEGWRSRRGGRGAQQPAAPRSGGRAAQAATSPAPAAAPSPAQLSHAVAPPDDWPWRGVVGWTLTYIAFLAYCFVVITYRVPGADVAMAIALIGLPFLGARLSFPPFLLLMGAFVAWCAVGLLSTQYPPVVREHLLLITKLWLIALVAVNALRSPSQIRLFSFLFLGCFMLFPARGAMVNYLGGYNVWGRALWNYIYANPNDLAALALLPLGVGVGLLKVERFKWTRYLTIASVAILPLLILMTQSRGAFLALLFFGGLFLLGQRKRARMLLVMALLGVMVVAVAPRGVWERVRGLGQATSTENLGNVDREGSARQRFEIWRVATSLIGDHAVTGVGFGAYIYAHAERVIAGDFNRTARGQRDTHSTYLNVAAETGLPGLALFLAMVTAAIVSTDRIRRRWRTLLPDEAGRLYALELALGAYMIAGIFGSFSRLSFLYIFLAYMYAVARSTDVQGLGALSIGGGAPHPARAPTPRRGALVRGPAARGARA